MICIKYISQYIQVQQQCEKVQVGAHPPVQAGSNDERYKQP